VSINPDDILKKSRLKYYPRCQDPACTGLVASFGYEADRKRVRCSKHKKKGMVNITRKSCEHPACDSAANYGAPGSKASASALFALAITHATVPAVHNCGICTKLT
jgi:EsV-1-7 cysteine-rich motif